MNFWEFEQRLFVLKKRKSTMTKKDKAVFYSFCLVLYFKRFFSFYVLYVLYEYVNYLRNGVQARKLHLNDQAISNNYRTEKMSYLKSNQLITLNINYTKRMSII